MKKFKIILSPIVLFLLATCTFETNKSFIPEQHATALKNIPLQQVEQNLKTNDNDNIDSLLVVMNNAYRKSFYQIQDFIEVNPIDVVNLTDDPYDHVHTEHCTHEQDESGSVILKIQLSHSGNESILKAIKKLQARKDIISVEPNYTGKMHVTTPNDVNLTTDWYIQKIELNKAWDISVGLSEVKVGVIDTGIAGTHRDLTNRVDSSLSVSYSPNPGNALQPGFFHGTWVAGIIGAQGNNGYDTSGVNWNVSLVSLRVDGPAAGVPAANGRRAREPYEEDMDAVISSIIYAKNNSIPIVNFSGGFDFDSVALQTAVQSYQGLIVCASGNSNWDIDLAGSSIYPASYSYSNIISVSATTASDTKASYSNYGKTKVHLFAPGNNIRGSSMTGGVRTETGTSAAAPIVAGVAALIKAVNPNLTTTQIKSAILNNVDVVSGLSSYCITGGRLNAYKAIKSVIPTYTALGTELNSPTAIPTGNYQWFKFTAPYAETYTFQTTGALNTSGSLFSDSQAGTALASSSTGGSGNNFALNYTLSKGQTVFIRVQNHGATGNFKLKITSPHTHSYGAPYVWLNLRQHRATCSCTLSMNQGHAVSSDWNGIGTTTCLICGGPAEMGFVQQRGTFSTLFNNNYPEIIMYFGNGSYVLSNGISVISNEDLEDLYNGTLEIPCLDCEDSGLHSNGEHHH